MRIGLIARADNSGLGTLSQMFFRNLKPTKVLIVQNGVFQIFPDRFAGAEKTIVPATGSISRECMEWITTDVDLILSFETFYNFDVVAVARKKGVKTVLMTMCELFPEHPQAHPDLYLCPSQLDLDMMPTPKAYLPVPIETDKLHWRLRETATTFIHTASHGGVSMRKGTPLLLQAMKHVKADIKVKIYSWRKFHTDDPRVEVCIANFQNYWQLWREGDVLIYPQDANGICLPVQEAYAAGLGVLTTNIYPFNTWLPKEMMFEPTEMYTRRFGNGLLPVQAARIDPVVLAQKIDEVAHSSISSLSERGRDWAKANSWEVQRANYLTLFENLCLQK